jgi:hypothetical protein
MAASFHTRSGVLGRRPEGSGPKTGIERCQHDIIMRRPQHIHHHGVDLPAQGIEHLGIRLPRFGQHHQLFGTRLPVGASEYGDAPFAQPLDVAHSLFQLRGIDAASGPDDDVLGSAREIDLALDNHHLYANIY